MVICAQLTKYVIAMKCAQGSWTMDTQHGPDGVHLREAPL